MNKYNRLSAPPFCHHSDFQLLFQEQRFRVLIKVPSRLLRTVFHSHRAHEALQGRPCLPSSFSSGRSRSCWRRRLHAGRLSSARNPPSARNALPAAGSIHQTASGPTRRALDSFLPSLQLLGGTAPRPVELSTRHTVLPLCTQTQIAPRSSLCQSTGTRGPSVR